MCVALAMVSEISAAEALAQDSAFFNILVVEIYLAMLGNPNKPIDLLCTTVPQKYFVFITLGLSHFVLSYDWISIAAVVILGTVLHLIRSRSILTPAVAAFEKMVSCGHGLKCNTLGYVTV